MFIQYIYLDVYKQQEVSRDEISIDVSRTHAMLAPLSSDIGRDRVSDRDSAKWQVIENPLLSVPPIRKMPAGSAGRMQMRSQKRASGFHRWRDRARRRRRRRLTEQSAN